MELAPPGVVRYDPRVSSPRGPAVMRRTAPGAPRRRVAVTLTVLAFALALPACDDSENSPGRLRADLDAARDRWEAAGLTGYSVTQRRLCFCVPPHEWTVVVKGGVPAFIDSVEDPGGTGLNDYVLEQLALDQAMTVEQLFDWIQVQLALGGVVDATFDPELGYPARVSVDPVAAVADDEVTWELEDLAPPRNCTQIACGDELRVTLLSPLGGFAEGEYVVTVSSPDNPSVSCAFTFTYDACQPPFCSLGGDRCNASYFPSPDRIVLSSLPFRLGTVQVTVEIDGAFVAGPYLEPVYARSQPNGPLCPPVCWTADVETVLP